MAGIPSAETPMETRKKLFIVGAGGLGRIVLDVLSQDEEVTRQYILAGFLDTRSDLDLPDELCGMVIGSPLDYQAQPDEVFIPAIGDPKWRKKLLEPLIQQGANFYSYTKKASIAARTRIGKGVFLTPGTVISTDCEIGDYSYIDTYVIVGHDVKVGAHCMIGAMSFLAGGVRVEDGVAIHPRVTVAKEVVLGEGCTVGIGSVVIKNVISDTTVFGNPARSIFNREK